MQKIDPQQQKLAGLSARAHSTERTKACIDRFEFQPTAATELLAEDFPSGLMGQASFRSAITLRLEELCRDTEPTIYLIDDDPGIRDALSLLLGLKKLRVLVFANAEDFLASDCPQENACILLDIRLPGMGGLQLQRTLIAKGNWTPVIIMTANPNIAASRTAFKSGAVDFLLKPISEMELIEALCNAISRGGIKANRAPTRLENSSSLFNLTLPER